MRASALMNRGEAKPNRLVRALWAVLASITLVATGTGMAYATDLDSLSGGDVGTEDGASDSSGLGAQSFRAALENDGTGTNLILEDEVQSGVDDDNQQSDPDLDSPQSGGVELGEQQMSNRLLAPAAIEPFAAPGTATVTVTARVAAAGDATGTTGIGFTLYDGNTPTAYSCSIVSDAGECTIEVPTAGLGKAYRVVQTSTPSNLFANPQFYVQGTSGAAGSATRQINYVAGLTPVLQSTNEVSMPAQAVITQTGGATSARDRSLGNVLSSRYNVPRNTCVAVDVAGLIDVSTSITDAQLTQYRNGIKQGIDGLVDTGATLQMFTFGTVSPASGTSPSPRLLVTAANATILKDWVDTNIQRSKVGTQYTNWASGIQAVQAAGASDQFTAMLLVTDGAPNRPTSDNMSDTNVRALEEAIYAANTLKAAGTRSIGVGIGLGGGVAQTNLRAVSDPVNFYNVDNFQGLGDLLTSLGTDLTTCTARISVTKFQGSGPDDANAVALPNWPVNAVLNDPATGVSINPATSQQTGAAGEPASWTVTFPTEASTFDATISETPNDAFPFQTGRYRIVSGTPGAWVTFDEASFAVTGLGVGNDVEVEFYNNEIPAVPEWTLTKSSDPVSESSVNPGQTITYTLTATNTSATATLTGATAEDDLSNVLNNAVLTQPLATGLSLAGTRLTWDVPTLAPGANASVSYTVTVNEGAYGVTIGNVVTAGDEVPPPSNCDDSGVCGETEHYTPAWDLTKSSDPVTGSTVSPGDTITYTLTAKNTSDAALLVGATAEDDLSEVLNNATLVEPLASGLTLNGTTLTWNFGTLNPEQTATVSYQVVVDDDAVGVTIGNVVTGKGDIPPNPCPADNENCRETEHPTPSWSLVKSSDPIDGSTVNPGSDIVYTLTATNTSETATLRALTITDDLSNVLNNATKVGSPTATAGVVLYNPAIATQLIWTIDELEPGETATATYTVNVNADAYGVTIANVATPQGPVPPDPCPSSDETCRETEHFTPEWTLTKDSDPESGSTVVPGSEITYTLTATNTSENAVLEGATGVDDLSNVLNNATLTEPLAAGLSLSGTTLTWTIPDLDPGESASVDYKVTVNADALGVTIGNVVTSGGDVPPPTNCEADEPCGETEHYTPAWDLTKSSDPASGSTVVPGDTITYTVTAKNTSENAVLEGATGVDDLSNVLNNATLTEPLAAGLTLSGTTLTWSIPDLESGESASVSYEVTVNADAIDVTIGNVVTGGGDVPPNPCAEGDPECRETEHYTPAWDLTKVSDPESGSTVDPGSEITYTLTATNTSENGVLSGAEAVDDLSNVLNNATLTEPLASGLVLNGTTLAWSIPDLEPGESTSVDYKVTVNEDAVGVTIGNVVTFGGDVPPPNDCVVGEPCGETEHYTPEWDLTKNSDPASGSTVVPGDTITYTLTATNTSENAVLSGARAVDDLSAVLNNATLTEPLASGLVLNGTTLTWTIPDLEPGESVSVDYVVTVNAGAYGVDLANVVTGEGSVPPNPCSEEDPSCRETDHHTPAWNLKKSSDPKSGSRITAGQTVTYTLTATNTSNATVEGAKAVDDMSKVLNNATIVAPLDASLQLNGTNLTWSLPTLKPGESATVSYQVKVKDLTSNLSLLNVVKPLTPGGECVANQCSTNHSSSLPNTGAGTLLPLAVGAGLLLLGGLGIGVSRRQRRGQGV